MINERLYLPTELFFIIFENLSLKDLINLMMINRRFFYIANSVFKNKKKRLAFNFTKKTIENVEKYYKIQHYSLPIKNHSLEIRNKMNEFINQNIYKKWFDKLDPKMLAFFLFEWVGLKNNISDDNYVENIEYLVSRYRGEEDYSTQIQLLNSIYVKLYKFDNNLIDKILTYY